MGCAMSVQPSASKFQIVGLSMALFVAGLYCLASGNGSLLTPDQLGYRLFARGLYQEAAEQFTDPIWKGVAHFKQGDFQKSEGVFSGLDTADAAFNHGNALVMQGKYEEAAERYSRALELSSDWEAAIVNRGIALARADSLKKEGGEMTGGRLAADEIVHSEGEPTQSAGEEQTEGVQELSDAELRAVWLRQVQTKPADFLRVKFAYQHATRDARGARRGTGPGQRSDGQGGDE